MIAAMIKFITDFFKPTDCILCLWGRLALCLTTGVYLERYGFGFFTVGLGIGVIIGVIFLKVVLSFGDD